MINRCLLISASLGFAVMMAAAEPTEPPRLVWPTPNAAFSEGRPLEDFVQPTAPGRWESALFGCVRNDGRRFHGGVDLKPISRDRRGEAADPIFAVMDGVVVYINRVAGNSSFGRYIVIEHPAQQPTVHTLYAHLASVAPGIEEGAHVRAGQTIAIMGRSAGGYTIPRERAHLHFEIGFRFTDDFENWYRRRNFRTPNQHGVFNGLNLIGIDPLDFFNRYRTGEVRNFTDYIATLPVAFTLAVRSSIIPDFVRRYPELVSCQALDQEIGGWEIDFTWYGLPKRWRPLLPGDERLADISRHEITFFDPELLDTNSCRNTVLIERDRPRIGSHTERVLELLFGG